MKIEKTFPKKRKKQKIEKTFPKKKQKIEKKQKQTLHLFTFQMPIIL